MLRDVFAITVLGAVCGYAAWQELQFLAVVALFGLVGLLYKVRFRRAMDIVMELLRNTGSARIEKTLQKLSQNVSPAPNWVRIIASKLDGSHIGLVLSIYRTSEYPLSGAVKDKMRDLRASGLISCDAQTMEESSHVWLTETGVEFAKALLASPNGEH